MNWFVTQSDQLRAMFGEFFRSRVTEAIMSLARPALRLSSGLPAERSRLGGRPVLPAAMSWPRWGERPLDFLGVIDFGELASVLWLPELPGTGSAAFYYATEPPRPWGDDPAQSDGWRVLPGAVVPAGPAASQEHRLGAAPFVSLPSPHEPALRPIGVGAAFAEVYPQLYESWASFTWGAEPRHQAGGWPMAVQRTLWPDTPQAIAADWRLLLQLDSDDRFGWRWGATGFVYFSARAADVRSGALDRSWLILQATA
jgi:uncharacterized protein YwqG